MSFGAYVRQTRVAKKITIRDFAKLISVSPVVVSNFETDNKPAPPKEVLQKISTVFCLSPLQEQELYDLAKTSHTAKKPPINGEITVARVALRVAKGVYATDEEWEDFMKRFETNRDDGG